MAIELTQTAADHVSRELARRGKGKGLRVGTERNGCTGFAYTVDYADEIGADDHTYSSHGVTVVVDHSALSQLDGTVIDFVKTNLLNEGFEFRNPNVKEMCGCGESFSV